MVQFLSVIPKITGESQVSLKLQVQANVQTQDVRVTGRKGEAGQAQVLTFGQTQIAISHVSRRKHCPFRSNAMISF